MPDCMNIGGQAVLEGVMMRAPRSMTVAVRTPSGGIVMKKDPLTLLADRWKFLKWPVLRGTVTLFSSLALGMKALNFSANVAIEEEGDGKDKGKPLSDLTLALTMAFSLGFGLLLFFYLPLYLTQLSREILPITEQSSIAFNLVDGVIRIIVFLLYIIGISRMKDIRRVFEYHGAEHKAIYAYEQGGELTVDEARKFSTLHPRCGTSFLIVVMVLSIFVFSLVPKDAPFYMKALSRLVLIPVIAGLSYEFIKYSSKHMGSAFIKATVAPGLWLQRLTTREPSDDQLEVAIHALKEALAMEKGDNKEVATCLGS
ncbi:MAG: DUF1385 domain-containing protein [Nitrospirae bacterium]|nr:DUF1385 domain-containing protein [Nitrospirota bacterium]